MQGLAERMLGVDSKYADLLREMGDSFRKSIYDVLPKTERNRNHDLDIFTAGDYSKDLVIRTMINIKGHSKGGERQKGWENMDSLDKLCADYLEKYSPEVIETKYTDKNISRLDAERKLVEEMKERLINKTPRIAKIYNLKGGGIPSSVKDTWRKMLEKELAKTGYVIWKDKIEKVEINENFGNDIKIFKDRYKENKKEYEMISEATGFPVELVAAIHFREGVGDLKKSIENGAPISPPPANENIDDCVTIDYGYDKVFVDNAISIINEWKLDERIGDVSVNNLSEILDLAVRYNGDGYETGRAKGNGNPYIFSGTNLYKTGKYISDGNYDKTAIDDQVGIYRMLVALREED